jgi:hypothetical protein
MALARRRKVWDRLAAKYAAWPRLVLFARPATRSMQMESQVRGKRPLHAVLARTRAKQRRLSGALGVGFSVVRA